ncbi:TIGR04013 family B12-binding domain/radical SAM domain-containing protein [Geovibrio thiophilus]|uniref:TIGR04013 family B12-binding domain/radical SAM domain-containing protein n=1 Tax=Geovibrio thiophilus TaxID=139438 RepID=UPI0013E4079E|nr:TIGR04013 family B12-binding domain/radical SAM domain-containing protein [Geovibrio thiophilus]
MLILSHKFNKNSIAALTGALQICPETAELEPSVLWNREDIVKEAAKASEEGLLPVVCFSFTTLHFLDTVKELLLLKKQLAKLPVPPLYIAGGAHPSGSVEETLGCGFDYAVKGEGEYAFPALTAALINETDPCEIRGVCRLENGRLVSKGRAQAVNLDDYPPFPERLIKFSYIEITRGCPVACRYCQTSYIQGARYRHRAPEKVLGYAERLVSLGVKDLRFITPDCLSYGSRDVGRPNLPFLEKFLSDMKKCADGRNIHFGSFPSEVFPTSVTEESMELLAAYVSNGNMVIGAQTGSDRLMRHIGRSHTVDDVRRAVRIILGNGFAANVDFMFGLPGETEEDEEESIRFMTELFSMGAKVHSHTFMPLAGTPFGNLPPVTVSPKTAATLEKLAGYGIQYGSWKAQMEKSNRLAYFRKVFAETGDAEKAVTESDNYSVPPLQRCSL